MISVKGSNRELATAAPTQCLGPVNTSTHTDTGTRTMSPLQLQEAAILEHNIRLGAVHDQNSYLNTLNEARHMAKFILKGKSTNMRQSQDQRSDCLF